jgi:hypothetical protein
MLTPPLPRKRLKAANSESDSTVTKTEIDGRVEGDLLSDN